MPNLNDPNPVNNWADYQAQLNGGGNTERDIAQGILAPGISWIAQATGNAQTVNNATDFGGIFHNSIENKDMTQDVYNSMSQSDWDAFRKMGSGQQSSFIQGRAQQIAQQKPFKTAQDKMIAQLQSFADEMNMPVDQLLKQDAFAKMLHGTTIAQGVQQGRGAGLGIGGYSQNAANASASKALLGYQMQRQQAGNQALSQINDIYNQQQGMQLSTNALNQQANNNYQAQQAANQQKVIGGLTAAFGGGAGAAFGAASSMKNSNTGVSNSGSGTGYPNNNYGTGYSGGGPSYGTYQTSGNGMSGVGYNNPSPIPTNNGGNY